MTLSFESVSFLYPTEPRETFSDLTFHLSPGWTAVTGAHGSGKSTLLQLSSGRLTPIAGRVRIPGRCAYCPQSTTQAPDSLSDLLQTPDGLSAQLTGKLRLGRNWVDAWSTLSPGEQRRAQIACALWEQPDVLALDEPTALLDVQSRSIIAGILSTFRGIGLLASHDRELMDRLCTACLMLEPGKALLRRGNYTQAHAIASRELETLRRQKESASRQFAALAATVDARRQAANQANDKRSKRYLDPRDSDARQKLDRARKTGKDARAGQLLKQLQGRLAQTAERADSIDVIAPRPLPAELAGQVASVDVLCRLPAQSLSLSAGRTLQLPELTILPNDRIGISGPTDAGQSQLLDLILRTLAFDATRIARIPLELSPNQAQGTLDEAHDLPEDKLPLLTTALASLGASAEQLLSTDIDALHPADVRKLHFALALLRRPHLLILEDPTAHFDLPSLEHLETALTKCPCAILLATQDTPLLQNLTRTRWTLTPSSTTIIITPTVPQ